MFVNGVSGFSKIFFQFPMQEPHRILGKRKEDGKHGGIPFLDRSSE